MSMWENWNDTYPGFVRMHRNIILVMIQMHKQSCLERALIDLLQLIHKSVARIFIKWYHEKFYLAVDHIFSDVF